MIVALASTDDSSAAGLASTLAALRTSSGSKVLLVKRGEAQGPAQFMLDRAYDDVVIDASGDDSGAAGAALAAAGVIIALIPRAEMEARDAGALLRRIKAALDANPRAEVLVAIGDANKTLSAHEVGNILVFVAQLASARLADTLVLDDSGAYHPRHGATGVRHLYSQVFRAAR
jgi:hypothetical protein